MRREIVWLQGCRPAVALCRSPEIALGLVDVAEVIKGIGIIGPRRKMLLQV